MRVGQGFDAHALVEGRALILGGVRIPHARGLQGHSDADVLIHAICDACLGAAGRGDIGRHFPDSDKRFKDVDSRVLLRRVKEILDRDAFEVANVDATVIAQAPRLAPYVPAMTAHVAADLGLDVTRVNIKATTTDRLGFVGREEGIAALAVVLLVEKA